MANSNQINNFIEMLLVDGSIPTDQNKIRSHVVQFVKELLSEQFSWRPKLDDLTLKSVWGGVHEA